MKKILTFCFSLLVIGGANAQDSREEARRVILGNPKTTDTRTGNERDVILGGNRNDYPEYPRSRYPNSSRESSIDQVNREYDNKIYSIRNNPYLSASEKEKMIRQLERDRAYKLRQINGRYSQDRHYDRKDNGKHLGWEKGKGNPHKYGGKDKKNNKKDWD